MTEKNLNEARENWAEFMNDLSELSSYKEIEKVVSKWDNELIQEKTNLVVSNLNKFFWE